MEIPHALTREAGEENVFSIDDDDDDDFFAEKLSKKVLVSNPDFDLETIKTPSFLLRLPKLVERFEEDAAIKPLALHDNATTPIARDDFFSFFFGFFFVKKFVFFFFFFGFFFKKNPKKFLLLQKEFFQTDGQKRFVSSS